MIRKNFTFFSTRNEWKELKEQLTEYLNLNKQKEFAIILMREENETEEFEWEILCEYPIIGKLLIDLVNENENIRFENETDWKLCHIMNKVVIL